MRLLCVLSACFAVVTHAYPFYGFEKSVKHAWAAVPPGWIDVGVPPADYVVNLKIGLKQGGIDDLLAALHEISDPSHSRYGQHLSKREVEDLVAPHESTRTATTNWLLAHGINLTSIRSSLAHDWLTVPVTLPLAETLLSASYRTYQHLATGERVVRTLSYSIPTELYTHIDLVHPTTMFDRMKAMRATYMLDATLPSPGEVGGVTVKGPAGQDIPLSCNTTVTPACLQVLYRMEGYIPKAADKGNKIGIAGYLEQYVNFADLQSFFLQFRPDATGTNVTVVSVDGGLNDQGLPGVEADLDVQYTEGLTYPTPNYYYSTPGIAPTINDSVTPPQRDEPYLDWLTYLLALPDGEVPQVFTTSYGGDEQTFPSEWAIRVCGMFAQLTARGSSIMFSSGDGGVGAGTCKTNDGTNRTLFQPVFPATCPYITGVGATYQIAPEKGVYFSQGGFSRYFERPVWQAAMVPPFLEQLGTTYAGLYDPAGRAVPDVSAQGYGFRVVVGGQVESVGGTSASSPTFASIVSLLNDYRIANGRSSLGWLNPLLYTVGVSGFTDILLGNNPGCGTPGFNATEGWDAITGLGTPDFVKLQELLGFI